MTFGQKLNTVWAFFLVNLRRTFRDKTALFFTFLFPLIFLFVFGSLNSGNNSVSFKIAIINKSNTSYAKQFVGQLQGQKTFKIDKTINTISKANEKMSRGELDATLELPSSFGQATGTDTALPTGQAVIRYTQNSQQAAQTLQTILQAELQSINSKLVKTETPFTVTSKQNNERSLSAFDYTFAGLLGFAIIGSGIFGPINIFPELKKMGILRRLHTTPLRVWQYFLSTVIGNVVVGLMSLAVMFVVAITVFDLKVVGNYFELAIYLAIGIITVLGIGLGIGGWAKNERQAAPLANIIVFPMLFLSGTFFPRFLMPHFLQNITAFLPLTPVIDGARLIATQGAHLTDLGPQLALMGGWIIIIYAIAFRTFRWE